MTDKELKKLSRLELLELLLEASNENKRLKDKIKKMTSENEASKSIENLATTTKQASDILDYANRLVETIKAAPADFAAEKSGAVKNVKTSSDNSKNYTDRNLYLRIMNFYAKNVEALEVLPPELKNDITNRIKEILENRRNNS